MRHFSVSCAPVGRGYRWLAFPLNVLAQHSVGGVYVAKVDKVWKDGLVAPAEASLLVEDHNSRLAVAVPGFIGTYDRTNWTVPRKNDRGY